MTAMHLEAPICGKCGGVKRHRSGERGWRCPACSSAYRKMWRLGLRSEMAPESVRRTAAEAAEAARRVELYAARVDALEAMVGSDVFDAGPWPTLCVVGVLEPSAEDGREDPYAVELPRWHGLLRMLAGRPL